MLSPTELDVDLLRNVKMLFDALRNPTRPPAVNHELNERLDVVDERLARLAESQRQFDAALRRR